jgi:hypothetical protein
VCHRELHCLIERFILLSYFFLFKAEHHSGSTTFPSRGFFISSQSTRKTENFAPLSYIVPLLHSFVYIRSFATFLRYIPSFRSFVTFLRYTFLHYIPSFTFAFITFFSSVPSSLRSYVKCIARYHSLHRHCRAYGVLVLLWLLLSPRNAAIITLAVSCTCGGYRRLSWFPGTSWVSRHPLPHHASVTSRMPSRFCSLALQKITRHPTPPSCWIQCRKANQRLETDAVFKRTERTKHHGRPV